MPDCPECGRYWNQGKCACGWTAKPERINAVRTCGNCSQDRPQERPGDVSSYPCPRCGAISAWFCQQCGSRTAGVATFPDANGLRLCSPCHARALPVAAVPAHSACEIVHRPC